MQYLEFLELFEVFENNEEERFCVCQKSILANWPVQNELVGRSTMNNRGISFFDDFCDSRERSSYELESRI